MSGTLRLHPLGGHRLPAVVRAQLAKALRSSTHSTPSTHSNALAINRATRLPPLAQQHALGRPAALGALHPLAVTLSFFKFGAISDPEHLVRRLRRDWGTLGILGRTYVAHEGINAQLSVPVDPCAAANEGELERMAFNFETSDANGSGSGGGVDGINAVNNSGPRWRAFVSQLSDIPELGPEVVQAFNFAFVQNGKPAFDKNIIRARKAVVSADTEVEEPVVLEEILQDGLGAGSRHASAEEWNELLKNRATSGAALVDMRNFFETQIGRFDGAMRARVATFREQLPLVEKQLHERGHDPDAPVMIYCTGGIRCVKAAAFLKKHNWKNVVQLEGGIVHYAQRMRELGQPSQFLGKNFVFDTRLGEKITEDVVARCHQCGSPADTHTNCINWACHHLFIQCSVCATKYSGACSAECKRIANLPEEEYREHRKKYSKTPHSLRVGARLPYGDF